MERPGAVSGGAYAYSPPITPMDSQLSATAKQMLLHNLNINTEDTLNDM